MVHEVFIRSVASFSSETQKQAEKKLWNQHKIQIILECISNSGAFFVASSRYTPGGS